MAKKDPAFLFYPKDWIQGTAKLMPEEKGVYIDLLAHQHQDKDLPTDTKRLARIVGLSESDFLPIWEAINNKFEVKNNRLVNRKLTELMTERSEKGWKNKIIGTLASVIRLSEHPYDVKYQAKKTFDYNDFLDVPEPNLTETITEWFVQRLKSIGNGNAIGNGNDNTIVYNSNSQLWFLKYYHSTYEIYKSAFNGQSTNNEMFLVWKSFIDFIYENKFEEIFECKFINPHDFAKLVESKKFTKDRWANVIQSILSTGIKPEHNLFFRIPKFMEFEKSTNGTDKQPVNGTGTTRFNAGQQQLLAKIKQKHNQ